MRVPRTASPVLVYQGFGFGLIALLSLFNNVLDLPRMLSGGEPGVARWRYGVLETAIILLIWAFAFSVTRRLLLRLRRLEGMLRLCAWCRKIGYRDQWMAIENYFAEGFQVRTTHGICPDCLKKVEEDTRKFYRRECESAANPASGTGESATPPLPA